ncbi:MAG: DUF1285 domain-containing protein [bacterium]
MADLLSIAAQMGGLAGTDRTPPVEKWNPDYCGEMDIKICRNGIWLHEGTPIGRAELVQLFSTILRREGEEFFLVTPIEKMKITVEDAPFLAVAMEVIQEGKEDQIIRLRTNVADEVEIGPDHPLFFRAEPHGDQALVPYARIRRNLDAMIGRNIYYDLMALAVQNEQGQTGFWSHQVFFPLQADASQSPNSA